MGNKDRTVLTGIDVCKLVAALMVVILHCLGDTLGKPGELFVRNITTMAVPFFFISSGYFFSKGLFRADREREYAIEYVKKILVLYVFWGTIYLLIKMPGYVSLYGDKPVYLFFYIVRKMVFVGMGVYWYFLALAESVVLLYISIKLKQERLAFVISFCFFVYGVLFSGFQNGAQYCPALSGVFHVTYVIFSWTNNFLFTGWFYVMAGYMLLKQNVKLSSHISLILLICSVGLKFIESFVNEIVFGGCGELILFQAVEGIFFFLFGLSFFPRISYGVSIKLRNLSTTIFLLHSIFLFYIDDTQEKNGIVDFVLVVTLCCVCDTIVSRLNHKHINGLFNRR